MELSVHDIRYLELLSKKFPTLQKASTEIINLKAIMSLPKGTEIFLSDLHGEYEVFTHLINSASGIIKSKIHDVFKTGMTEAEVNQLATLIYYPAEKLRYIRAQETDLDQWYRTNLYRLIKVCRVISSKYTRSKVRKSLPHDFAYVIEELLHVDENLKNKQQYYDDVIDTIISTGRANEFVIEICMVIRRLSIDRLHIVGDIFDRGPHPDLIMDELMRYRDVDIQWGNHDIVWMGAAMGSYSLIATLIRIAARYDNLSTIEDGYGINLMPLATFAMNTYKDDACKKFMPKLSGERPYTSGEVYMIQQMHKAISIIQFKLEGQIIKMHPEFGMDNRLLLDKIDKTKGTVLVDGVEYALNDVNFPTIDANDPYRLTTQEQELMERIRNSFLKSDKLQKHLKYLINHGGMYHIFNSNLMYHGCIPLNADGTFKKVRIMDGEYSGKALLDQFDKMIRECYFHMVNKLDPSDYYDYLYYLWPGPDSPLFGKAKMATFERYFIDDPASHSEGKNAYFTMRDQEELSTKIMVEFGLNPEVSHIINGHVPVKMKKGENPVKGKGKMIVIDGGMSKAYQPETGIAGYTLLSNSHGLLLAQHEPFESAKAAIEKESDIVSSLRIVEKNPVRLRVGDTDTGKQLKLEVEMLEKLLFAYREGVIKEEI